MVRYVRFASVLATVLAVSSTAAQTPAADPSDRLREVLPADVAERVLAKIAEARARELPAAALENRALKLAARGVPATDVEKSVSAHADWMKKAREALQKGGRAKPEGDEIDAAAEAMRRGVDGAALSELARSAPPGRSLAMPLFVIGSLIDRGLPSDAALQRVRERLQARASDRDLEDLPGSVAAAHRPTVTGTDMAATKRPPSAGKPATAGPPPGVPRNAGKGASPSGGPGRGKRP